MTALPAVGLMTLGITNETGVGITFSALTTTLSPGRSMQLRYTLEYLAEPPK